MAYPIWITPAGSLGIIPENEFYEIQLDAYNPGGGTLNFVRISGQLPPGLQVTNSGMLQGVPVVTGATSPSNRTYEFGVRITNTQGQITDQSFSVTVSNIIPVQIVTVPTNLGYIFDGSFFSLQLTALEVDPAATLTWTLVDGTLPNAVSLSTSGLLSGFVYPIPTEGVAGLTGYSNAPYNEFGYDNAPTYRNESYTFTVQVSDGATTDQRSYTFDIVAKDLWTADDSIDVISDNDLTVDKDNIYIPIVTTPPESLPSIRGDSNFAFQFNAVDANGDQISFSLTTSGTSSFDQGATDNQTYSGGGWVFSGGGPVGTVPGVGFDSTGFDQQTQSLPPGLTLDSVTGWLSGHVPSQAAATETYNFIIQAYKTYNPTYISLPESYNLTILGSSNDVITWTTPASLGTIENGSISEINISAVSSLGNQLIYSLAPLSGRSIRNYGVNTPGVSSKLPQGLKLLPSGLLIGRAGFEYFNLDSGTTTLDGGTTTFDNTYTFTVLAESINGFASSMQTFTVTVLNYNKKPYENLYLKALPSLSQRQTFLNIVNNREIFPDELIYRATDPWFGRATDIRSLFLPGLNPTDTSIYAEAMATNHYDKRIEFGQVQTARAVDANFNTKYEVVYIPLIDNEIGINGAGPADVTHVNYLDFSGNVYPNSFENMSNVVGSALGYANRGALPDWMTSPQTNQTVLGFLHCIVLAYTVPGASALIAYRLQNNGITFNNISFVADRYDLDNALTTNYDIATGVFVAGKPTTFDRIIRIGSIAYTVDYAISGIPFDQINNQTVAYVQSLGGFDGVTNFTNGQTLIFAQQENYPTNTAASDGWLFPNGITVPGYVENLYDSFVPNERGGIWKINISGTNVITLTSITTITPGTQIQINLGRTHASSIMFYDSALKINQTVPAYSTVIPNTIPTPTIFDNNKTQFINNRDVYQDPETSNVNLEFPKTNPLY